MKSYVIPELQGKEIWEPIDFLKQYIKGEGYPITVRETGHIHKVKLIALREAIKKPEKLEHQIRDEALKVKNGPFTYMFRNVYDFGSANYVFGEATLSGRFRGRVVTKRFGAKSTMTRFSGISHIRFYDEFSDPFRFVETAKFLYRTEDPDLIPISVHKAKDFAGNPYDIIDTWTVPIQGTVKVA